MNRHQNRVLFTAIGALAACAVGLAACNQEAPPPTAPPAQANAAPAQAPLVQPPPAAATPPPAVAPPGPSKPVLEAEANGARLKLTREWYRLREEVTFEWRRPTTSANVWIGFATEGAPEGDGVERYRFVHPYTYAAGALDGTHSLASPEKPGRYELRMVQEVDGEERQLVSVAFELVAPLGFRAPTAKSLTEELESALHGTRVCDMAIRVADLSDSKCAVPVTRALQRLLNPSAEVAPTSEDRSELQTQVAGVLARALAHESDVVKLYALYSNAPYFDTSLETRAKLRVLLKHTDPRISMLAARVRFWSPHSDDEEARTLAKELIGDGHDERTRVVACELLGADAFATFRTHASLLLAYAKDPAAPRGLRRCAAERLGWNRHARVEDLARLLPDKVVQAPAIKALNQIGSKEAHTAAMEWLLGAAAQPDAIDWLAVDHLLPHLDEWEDFPRDEATAALTALVTNDALPAKSCIEAARQLARLGATERLEQALVYYKGKINPSLSERDVSNDRWVTIRDGVADAIDRQPR